MKVKIEVEFELGLDMPLGHYAVQEASKNLGKKIQDKAVELVHDCRHPFVINSDIRVKIDIASNTLEPVVVTGENGITIMHREEAR